jgi:hypothetical protein
MMMLMMICINFDKLYSIRIYIYIYNRLNLYVAVACHNLIDIKFLRANDESLEGINWPAGERIPTTDISLL